MAHRHPVKAHAWTKVVGECELCGAVKVTVHEVKMGRATVLSCVRCMNRSGTKAMTPAHGIAARTPVADRAGRRHDIMRAELELRSDAASIVRTARESKGWDRAELGRRIGERVNVITTLESGRRTPDTVLKKVERALSIELLVPQQRDTSVNVTRARPGSLTIGDLLDVAGDEDP